MSNEVFDAVRTVLAIREFQDKAIPDDVLKRIAEAGRLTASGSNKQPWHFVFVTDRDRLKDLGRLVLTRLRRRRRSWSAPSATTRSRFRTSAAPSNR